MMCIRKWMLLLDVIVVFLVCLSKKGKLGKGGSVKGEDMSWVGQGVRR